MTKEERASAVDAIIDDPEPTFASIRDNLRSTTAMTEEQLEWSEGYARFVLGFPKPKPSLPNPERVAEANAVAAT